MLLTVVVTMLFSAHGAAYAALAGIAGLAVLGACATSPELGAALGEAGMCAAQPQPRDMQLIDRIDPARGAAPGREFTVQWNEPPAQDSRGRYAHVKSIVISTSLIVTSNGANVAVSGYQLRSLFTNINLNDAGGHSYYPAINGRTIVDDNFLRGMKLRNPLDGVIPANLPAGNHLIRIDLDCMLVSDAPGASPIEGILTLAALQMTNGSQGFRCTMGTTILGTPAGLTVVSFQRDDGNPGVDVLAEIVYLDQLVIDAPWTLDEYTINEPNSTAKRPTEKTEYLAVRYFPEDAPLFAGQQLAAGINNISMACAGMSFGPNLAIDFVRRQVWLERYTPGSAASYGLPALAQPAEPGVTVPMLLMSPPRARETAPAGPISFKFATQPSAFARFVHRTTGCDTEKRAARILAAANCGTSTCFQPGNMNAGVTDPTAPKVVVPMKSNGG